MIDTSILTVIPSSQKARGYHGQEKNLAKIGECLDSSK